MGSDDAEDDHERVLAPDDLDITNRPEVEEIDDGRYVVSPNGPAKKPDRDLLENPDWLTDETDEDTEPTPQQSGGRSPSDAHPSPDPQPQNERRTNQPPQTESTRQSTPTDPTQSPDGQPQSQPTDAQPSAGSSRQSTPTGQSTPPNQPTQSPPNQPPHSSSNQPTQSSPDQPRQSTPNQSAQSPSNQPQQPRSKQSQQSTPNQPQQSQSNQPQQSPPNQSTARSQSSNQPRAQNPRGGSRPDKPDNAELAAHNQPTAEPPAAEITNENVSQFLAESLAQASGDYGFDATLNVEGTVNRGRMTSDDIGETLETLLRWYARQTTDEVEPEHVLGIILAGSDLAVEYPVQSAYAVVKQHGLGPDDTISDLLAAVREEGSFTVPPSKE